MDIETLKETNKQLIETLDELNKIRATARPSAPTPSRNWAASKANLRAKLLEINA